MSGKRYKIAPSKNLTKKSDDTDHMALVLNNLQQAKADVRNLEEQLKIARRNADSMENSYQVAMIESMGKLGLTGKISCLQLSYLN